MTGDMLAAMGSLLTLCLACGLKRGPDYIDAPFCYGGVVVTERGALTLLAMTDRNPSLLAELDAVTRQAVRDVLLIAGTCGSF